MKEKPQNDTLKNYAKELRSNMNEYERILWKKLRGKRFLGYKFRRQVVIGNYIVDFLCIKHNLIIELDGDSHGEKISYDKKRDNFLQEKGYKVLRIYNNDLKENFEAVLELIYSRLNE